MTETVEVVQETPLLQTDRADTGRNIEGRLVQELPLGLSRNFQGMWATVPGSVTLSRPHSQFFNPQDSQETKFNGQSRLSNNVQIDGLDNNHRTGLLTVLIPSAEAIDSVNVTTSNFDAEFGRAGGSVTTVVMKSGTNQFKGSVFAFANNESTQAKNSFASATSVKPETKYQQFGATLGGPIIKDKLFFFTDYQRTVDNLGQLRRVVIPPAEWRNGDFSSASTKIYDPATGNADGTGRTPFPGNIIPTNRLSPVALNILAKIPQPNIPGAAFGQVNYELPSSEREKTTNAFNVKLNYNPTSSDQMSLRFSYQRPEIFVPGTFGELGGAGADFAGTGYQNTYSAALTWTRTLSQSLIMEWRAGYMKYHNEALSTGTGLDSSTEVGIPGANYDEFSSGISRISIGNGFTDPMVGFSPSLPWDRGEETFSVVGMLTKITGNHTVKVGTEVRHNEDFLLQIQDAGGVRGQFQFNGARTSIPTDSAATSGIANSFASFLLDAPSLVQRDIKVTRPAGHQALGRVRLRPGQVAGDPEAHRRPRPPLGVLHAARRHRGPGRPLDLQPVEQHGRGGRVRQHPAEHRRPDHVDELRPAARGVVPFRREDRPAGRVRHHDHPLPGQRVRVQLPGQAERAVQRRPTASRRPGAWLPGSGRRPSSPSRRAASWTPASRSCATLSSSTCPPT